MIVVVPMAGRGSRFADRGVDTPKPLIHAAGKPMVWWALQSLKDVAYSRIVFVALREHETQHGISAKLKAAIHDSSSSKVITDDYFANLRSVSSVRSKESNLPIPTEVILLDDVTEGQLCTVLEAREYIDTDEDVLIANCDTYIISDLGRDIANKPSDCHGIINVANMPGDRWSFARTDESGRVVEVTEKIRISDHASTGYYYFSSGRELCEIGGEMIRKDERTRGEFYVIPVYQKYIERGWRVDISPVREMWDMGTPESLAVFENRQKT